MSKRHGLPTKSLRAFMRDLDARMRKIEADEIDLAGLVGNRQTLSVLLASAAEVLRLRERVARLEARTGIGSGPYNERAFGEETPENVVARGEMMERMREGAR